MAKFQPLKNLDTRSSNLVGIRFSGSTSLRLGTCILILPQRNPLILAKEIATLDHLTNGKVELGIGVGWLKEEFEALGVPWERRGARTDEYVEALHAVWSGTDIEFMENSLTLTRSLAHRDQSKREFRYWWVVTLQQR